MLFGKPIDRIEQADLQRLIDDGVLEKKNLDYKKQFTGGSDSDKKELLYDLTSFANAGGGYLIFGIREKDGIPVEIEGIDSAAVDSERLRIESLLQDGVDPRIPGVRLQPVQVKDGKSVLIVHVPRSWAAPHMVKFKGVSKFYSRNSGGKYQLDVSELRTAFLLSETIAERIRNFRIERLGAVVANELPVKMSAEAKVILHFIPFSAFSPYGSREFHIPTIEEYQEVAPLKSAYHKGTTHRLNFDGFLACSPPEKGGNSIVYSQLFRNGIIETIESSLIRDEHRPVHAQNNISIGLIEKNVIEALTRYLSYYNKHQIEPPFVVLLSLLGTKGMTTPPSSVFNYDGGHPIDKNELIIPEILIENLTQEIDVVMRPAFDSIWNAAGHERSLSYDETGRLKK